LVLKALPKDSVVERVTLVGGRPVAFKHTDAGLEITMPPIAGLPGPVQMLRIDGKGIV
jgi:hypothetical protein